MRIWVRSISMAGPDARAFLKLPDAIYEGDPHYSAPFADAVLASVQRECYQGRQQVLLAMAGETAVARLVARVSPDLRDADDRPYGLLGFFEALDHPDAVGELFRIGIGWLRERGAGTIVGPMNGDTWHSYRLNIGPHAERPFLMEPYNPPYYPALWEANGFVVLERYYSTRVDDPAGAAERLEKKYRQARDAGYHFDPIRVQRFDHELERLYELSRAIFSDNFLYSEITLADFQRLYAGARRLIDPELVRFAVAPDGSDAGFLFGVPDRFRAVQAMRGSRGPLATLRFLALRGRANAVNLKSLGVLPQHRRAGLAGALMHLGYRGARDKGYPRVNLCLILDGNPSGRLDRGLGSLIRRYRLYQWSGRFSP